MGATQGHHNIRNRDRRNKVFLLKHKKYDYRARRLRSGPSDKTKRVKIQATESGPGTLLTISSQHATMPPTTTPCLRQRVVTGPNEYTIDEEIWGGGVGTFEDWGF